MARRFLARLQQSEEEKIAWSINQLLNLPFFACHYATCIRREIKRPGSHPGTIEVTGDIG